MEAKSSKLSKVVDYVCSACGMKVKGKMESEQPSRWDETVEEKKNAEKLQPPPAPPEPPPLPVKVVPPEPPKVEAPVIKPAPPPPPPVRKAKVVTQPKVKEKPRPVAQPEAPIAEWTAQLSSALNDLQEFESKVAVEIQNLKNKITRLQTQLKNFKISS